MSELGYVEGRNLIVEARFADGVDQRLSALATELVQSKVDVIVTTGGPVNLAARAATKTIPIVMTVSSNPVGQGLAASLARPGGNITGMSTVNNEIGPKQVELLLETLRKDALIAVLENPNNPALRPTANNIQAAAQRRGKQVRVVPAGTPEQIERGFAAMSSSHADALIVLSDTFFLQQASQISTLALEHRLPSMFVNPEYALAGGLMSYGSDITGNFRRIATYVDKILKGAKPGDLPIEQPTQFELVINMKTAKGLGITIPQRVLLRADRVIE
jgi:putative ABC transport system substrate-binding protein